MASYNFDEKKTEYSFKTGQQIPVWKTPKYEQSKEKAIEIIEKYDNIREGDFWILMNEAKNGKQMIYTGLIISHNACLKLNNHLPEEMRFVPSCVSMDKDGYNKSLVYTYINDEQGIYEVGEVSKENCKNGYPYAMAYKRLFDRVVLKNSRLAYDGIYSDSEADEFKEPMKAKDDDVLIPINPTKKELSGKIDQAKVNILADKIVADGIDADKFLDLCKVSELKELSFAQWKNAIDNWENVKEMC